MCEHKRKVPVSGARDLELCQDCGAIFADGEKVEDGPAPEDSQPC